MKKNNSRNKNATWDSQFPKYLGQNSTPDKGSLQQEHMDVIHMPSTSTGITGSELKHTSIGTDLPTSLPSTVPSVSILTDDANQCNIHYKRMDIYPSPDEILTQRNPYVSRNIIEGRYQDVEQYLDIHFRLLREDFMAPLRKAICAYKNCKTNKERLEIPEFRIYPKAQFYKNSNITDQQRNTKEQIDKQFYKLLKHGVCSQEDINIDETFMQGSLLCFSSDNFKTLFFGTAVNLYNTPNGYVYVWLIQDVPFLHDKIYTMLECTNYFSPYYLVLKVLQNMDTAIFPMKRYIIDVKTENELPAYLTPTTRFSTKGRIFRVLGSTSWPSKERLNLNHMQYEAFRHALTSKFAVIQGPPGTGKTYLGLMIAKTLIENYDIIRCSHGKHLGPILIISFTNHALDQFLEGLIPYTESIVRIGKQSKSEKIKEFIFQGSSASGFNRRPHYSLMKELLKSKQEILDKLECSSRRHFDTQSLEESLQLHNLLLKEAYEQLEKEKQQHDSKSIYDKTVVGMTTSAAARSQHLLNNLRCPIVIVEEAAEILESHIIASLTHHCQHLILTGDHQQLRPNTSDYQINTQYRLGISLFERMVRNGMPCITLDVQHRMRPEICQLITPAIYPNLKNHSSVYGLDNILGIAQNVFFITHKHPEEEVGTGQKNPYEAKYILCLAKYLILQGYNPKQITILTTYKGQYHEIKQNCTLEDVRIDVVDNFQGEENEIILLSLVRSNEWGTIGFLRIENRVCVALSRAKKGFYMIGDLNILTQKSSLWRKIGMVLIKNNQVGNGLPLKCQIHPENITVVKEPKDFQKVPDGCCSLPCGKRLRCGHICPKKCHIINSDHKDYLCNQPCIRILCDLDHVCPKLCSQKCDICQIPVLFTMPCGKHQLVVVCSMRTRKQQCRVMVEELLKCGHLVKKKCYEPISEIICDATVTLILKCGHAFQTLCKLRTKKQQCLVLVEELLKCGHPVKKICYEPVSEIICDATVTLRLKCGHAFETLCKLRTRKQQCPVVVEELLKCGHLVKKKCYEPISEIVCDVTVTLILKCGHGLQTFCKLGDLYSEKDCRKICGKILKCGHACCKTCHYMIDTTYSVQTCICQQRCIPAFLREMGSAVTLKYRVFNQKCSKVGNMMRSVFR